MGLQRVYLATCDLELHPQCLKEADGTKNRSEAWANGWRRVDWPGNDLMGRPPRSWERTSVDGCPLCVATLAEMTGQVIDWDVIHFHMPAKVQVTGTSIPSQIPVYTYRLNPSSPPTEVPHMNRTTEGGTPAVRNLRELKNRIQADVILGTDDIGNHVTLRVEVATANPAVADALAALRDAVDTIALDKARQAVKE